MTTLETLKAARKLISDPNNWIQKVLARDALENEVYPTHPEATCFCMLGALRKAVGDWESYEGPRKELMRGFPRFMSIGEFNDSHTHAEVLAAFDEAIKRWDAK